MISKYTYRNLIWIDLESPTEEEVRHVIDNYNIPDNLSQEMLDESIPSKVDLYPNFIHLILHFPQISTSSDKGVEKEVDFIVGNNFMVTTHYEPVDSIKEFSKTFEKDTYDDNKRENKHAGMIFFDLIKDLYINSRRQLHTINLSLKDVENKIFEGKEGEMVEKISNINRTLLDFRQALRFHKNILISFENHAKKFFGEEFNPHIISIINEYNKTNTILDGHKEILDDLRNTNDSLLANKTKETMKILTIITFLISPVAVISNIFVINSSFLKINNPNYYYLVLLFMFVASLITYFYIKSKKWL